MISANCSFVRRPLRFFVCNWGRGDWKACLIGPYGAFLSLSTQSTFSHSELKHFEHDLRVQRRRQRKLRFQYLSQWYLEMHAGGTREWTGRRSTLTVLNDQVDLQRHSQLFNPRLYFITNTFNMGSAVVSAVASLQQVLCLTSPSGRWTSFLCGACCQCLCVSPASDLTCPGRTPASARRDPDQIDRLTTQSNPDWNIVCGLWMDRLCMCDSPGASFTGRAAAKSLYHPQ